MPGLHPAAHARRDPDRVACVLDAGGEPLTYRQLDEGSNRLARLLRHRGLQEGDGIAICMEAGGPFLQAAWAAQRSGLYYTPVNPALTAEEAAYVVADCGAKAVIASPACEELATELRGRLPDLATRLMVGGPLEGYDSCEVVAASESPAPLPDQREGRPLLYSSGTAGVPKGVRFPLPGTAVGAADAMSKLARRLYGLDESSVLLSPAPLHHAAPLRFAMAATRLGGTVVLMDRFDPLALLELIEHHRVTHALVVPTMLVRLLRLPIGERHRFDLSSLRCCIHGAGPCPVPVKAQMLEWWGPILHEYYAGTEENGYVACTPEEWLAHPGTVGRPYRCRVHIVGDDGEELPPGCTGTVYFESRSRFEYHNYAAGTRRAYDERGWSTLGDLGHLDDDGYLYLAGRRDDVIVTGGVNVHPAEAESVLLSHPAVADAVVLGVLDEELGQRMVALVQPVDMARAGPDLERELVTFCRERLASYKCPRAVELREDLPRQPTGKLPRRLLNAPDGPR